MEKTAGLVLLASLFTLSAPVSADVTANVALVSNYVFRGVSQTNDDPTVQGGLDYKGDSGFSLGIWGSGVDEGFEVDFYGAYNYNVDNGVGFGAGIVQYEYTDDQFSDSISEIYLQGRLNVVSLTYYDGSINHATNDEEYAYLNLSFDFKYEDQGFGFFWGNTDFDNGNEYDDSGLYYKMDFSGLELKASYTDNKGTNDDLFFITVGSSWEL